MLPNDVSGTLFAVAPPANKPMTALSEKYAPPGTGYGGTTVVVQGGGASFNTGFN